jgi:prepilin-type N-terminal cleavage/methylation domain-containing protein
MVPVLFLWYNRKTKSHTSKHKNMQNKNGFSLIEMLIVVAIIVVMTGVAIMSAMNSDQRDRTALDAEGSKVLSLIAGQKNAALSGSDSHCIFEASGMTYSVTNCGNPNPGVVYTMKNGITFQSATKISFVSPFATLWNENSNTAITSQQVITLKKGSTHSYQITITPAGLITSQLN